MREELSIRPFWKLYKTCIYILMSESHSWYLCFPVSNPMSCVYPCLLFQEVVKPIHPSSYPFPGQKSNRLRTSSRQTTSSDPSWVGPEASTHLLQYVIHPTCFGSSSVVWNTATRVGLLLRASYLNAPHAAPSQAKGQLLLLGWDDAPEKKSNSCRPLVSTTSDLFWSPLRAHIWGLTRQHRLPVPPEIHKNKKQIIIVCI